ncbi:MAG: phosphatidate cytidylyltransferase [Alphaproteobacteria bacterium]|nr:phosphatidate cytidylyltransferase [Alphaproteobacteria bacterium]
MPHKSFSSITLRLISSAILIPIVMCLIAIGEWFFIGLVALCIAIALIEWSKIAVHMSFSSGFQYAFRYILICIGFLYLSFSFLEMSYLREQEDGLFWTILFMISVWASDSTAYLFGKTIGGAKMSPTISPNKTWSGYAGALIGPALVLLAAVHVIPFFPEALATPSLLVTGLAGILVGIAGQSGDLMISAMKRKAGLKDTGALIPGHGGILDRIDALLLALPVYLAYVEYVTE